MDEKADHFLPRVGELVRNVPAVCYLFLVSLLLGAAAFYYTEMKFWRVQVESQEAVTVQLISNRFDGDLDSVVADLLIFAGNSPLLDFLEKPDAPRQEKLGQVFLKWGRLKSDYFQIRFLDLEGREVIRMDSTQRVPHLLGKDQLADFSGQYYFVNSIGLNQGEVYASAFDLTQQGGRIVRPIRPTVRYCTPVFDRTGIKRGLVEFDYEGPRLIEHLIAESRASSGNIALLNSDGYWLKGPRPEDEWGFTDERTKDRSFRHDFPEEWSKISSAEAGQFYSAGGFYVFRTIYSLPLAQRAIHVGPASGAPRASGVSPDAWKILSVVSASVLRAKSRSVWMRLLQMGLLGLVVFLWVSWNMARWRVNRERAARALTRQAQMLDLAQDAICMRNLNHSILYWNAGAERLYGWSREEVMGRNYLTIIRPASSTPWTGVFESLLARGHWSGEATGFHRNGTEIVTLNRLTLQRDDFGEPAAILSIATDISSRKEAEEKIAERTARLDALIDHCPLGIAVCDSAGVIQRCNNAFEILMHYPAEESVGRTLNDLIVPEELQGDTNDLNLRVRAGANVQLITRRRRKDGVLIDVEANGVPMMVEGAVKGFFILYKDITQRIKAESDLKLAKEAAEQASRAKSDFLAVMSHEIRTPMNGVIGMAGLLLDTPLNPEQREYAETVRQSADALLTIINDILDFSKIEAGKMTIELISCDLRVAIEDVAELMAGKAREKGLDLILRYSPDAPRRVLADAGRIRQVLINLTGNAIKFTSVGQVYINVECEQKGRARARMRFSIEDTGIGIPEEKLGTIFDRFTQADSSTTRQFGGTGLGLAISKQLVELMCGEIGVESRAGKGSKFWMVLPLRLALSPPQAELPAADLSGIHVLGVDDNPTNLFVLREQLNSWRLRNEMCGSGAEALHLLETARDAGDPFHIAILDQQMPGMDGETLCRRIKADPSLRDTLTVLLTSMGMRGDATHMKEAGFAAYLPKPTRQSQLFEALLAVWSAKQKTKGAGLVTRHTLAEMRAAAGAAKPHGAATHGEPSAAGSVRGRVLVVEDNGVNQKVAVRLLEKMAFRADVAADGNEALEMIELLPYDVILMDCQMPGMDGYEATREIRRREGQGPHRLIVAMTANAMVGDRERCLAAGMNDYLSKPIRSPELVALLDRFLGKPAMPPLAPAEKSQ